LGGKDKAGIVAGKRKLSVSKKQRVEAERRPDNHPLKKKSITPVIFE
jgi:hypothetical protein